MVFCKSKSREVFRAAKQALNVCKPAWKSYPCCCHLSSWVCCEVESYRTPGRRSGGRPRFFSDLSCPVVERKSPAGRPESGRRDRVLRGDATLPAPLLHHPPGFFDNEHKTRDGQSRIRGNASEPTGWRNAGVHGRRARDEQAGLFPIFLLFLQRWWRELLRSPICSPISDLLGHELNYVRYCGWRTERFLIHMYDYSGGGDGEKGQCLMDIGLDSGFDVGKTFRDRLSRRQFYPRLEG
jgi:hypothetical protein